MHLQIAARGRRRFDHFVAELSVAIDSRVPRYALWLRMHEQGWNPDDLSREDVVAFCGAPLAGFLAARGLHIRERARRRLQREMGRYDPSLPTPYERMARL